MNTSELAPRTPTPSTPTPDPNPRDSVMARVRAGWGHTGAPDTPAARLAAQLRAEWEQTGTPDTADALARFSVLRDDTYEAIGLAYEEFQTRYASGEEVD